MGYKVFISHSTRDRGIVISLANLLKDFGVEVIVAEWYLTPGARIDKKVFTQIRNSDCVVALLTRNGIRSNWVNQEIGYSFQENKPIIPLVEKGTDAKDLAALQGREYIEYDPNQPDQALKKLSTHIKSLKLKKEERQRALLVLGGLLAFLLLLSGGEK
ncbi:MAG: toll/interleukin-1 receptor domain-containing protein [candidate division WOR-3 bacterium]